MVSQRDTRALHKLGEDAPLERQIIVSRDPHRRQLGDVSVYPVAEFLAELWQHGY